MSPFAGFIAVHPGWLSLKKDTQPMLEDGTDGNEGIQKLIADQDSGPPDEPEEDGSRSARGYVG
jgi:hypothetical protein